MRQVLFEIWLSQPWSWSVSSEHGLELLGAGWVLLAVGLIYLLVQSWWTSFAEGFSKQNLLQWGGVLLGVSLLGPWGPIRSFPLFGYGVMVLLGFVTAIGFSYARAKRVGLDPELILDLSFWLLLSGIVGGRLAHLVQYHEQVFAEADSLAAALLAAVNLTKGGLVLIGALAGGAVGLFAFCRTRRVELLVLADLIIPAVFIGIGFGRIGCLLNGCCFGDRCELPWGITFPQGSTTFNELVVRGFVDPHAPATFPLHPTQIYSSLDGFILAFVTAQYYWYRRMAGDVFALGCVLYSLNRILTEFVRADEMGQFGTSFTISQWYSAGILMAGLLLWARRFRQSPPVVPQPA